MKNEINEIQRTLFMTQANMAVYCTVRAKASPYENVWKMLKDKMKKCREKCNI